MQSSSADLQAGKALRDYANARVLVVDDNVDLLKLISLRLQPCRFELETATSAEEALNFMALWSPDLVITDLQLPGMSGMELFQHIQDKNPLLPVIILTAHGTIPDAVAATQSGVASYLTKPFDSGVLLKQIEGALFTSGYTPDRVMDMAQATANKRWQRGIVGSSTAIRAILSHIERLADSDATVMFEGENGVGKDALARALHRRGDRAHKPLYEVDCAFYSEGLLEAELFGTAHKQTRMGILQEAHGGTILFKDFDEMSVEALRKLIQALIDKSAKPIDSADSYEVDIRVIVTSSTIGKYGKPNQELWELGDKIGLTPLVVPSLRERREDIPPIVNHCLQMESPDQGIRFSAAAMKLLSAAEWPGNTQQLVNVVKQCLKLTNSKVISEALVASRINSPLFKIPPLSNAQREFERHYLTELLKVTSGNVTQAANLAKRNRTEFHRLLKKHNIDAKAYRNSNLNLNLD